jgi:hypothetical protein
VVAQGVSTVVAQGVSTVEVLVLALQGVALAATVLIVALCAVVNFFPVSDGVAAGGERRAMSTLICVLLGRHMGIDGLAATESARFPEVGGIFRPATGIPFALPRRSR